MTATIKAIAIDGPAGAGKSTVAKRLAKELGFHYIDTGAMYRALTLKTLEQAIDPDDEAAVSRMAKNSTVDLVDHEDITKVYLDGRDVSREIREPDVTNNVSVVCSYAAVREALVNQQRQMAKEKPVIMDGRDIGSHVLKDAPLKIYLTADLPERGHRRYLEWQEKGIDKSEAEITDELAARDYKDSHRAINPLMKTDDAVLLDTTNMSIDEAVAAIIHEWKERNV